MKFLYIFLTHQKNLENCYSRISEMMYNSDFIVVQGGSVDDSYDEEKKILTLNCNDGYVGLPEKVMKTFHFLISNKNFKDYTHFVKLDDDMVVLKKFQSVEGDYLGNVHYLDGNRHWHVGRTGTFWDKIPYLGEFKPWCMGGFGYLVSRKVLETINFQDNADGFLFDNEMLSQIIYKKFKIAEISCPTKYFKDASSISFAKSIQYGLGVLGVSFKHLFARWNIYHSKLYR